MRSVVSLPSRISPAREFGVTNKVDNGGALLRGRECAFFVHLLKLIFRTLAGIIASKLRALVFEGVCMYKSLTVRCIRELRGVSRATSSAAMFTFEADPQFVVHS